MNCKKGDKAVIVRSLGDSHIEQMLGKVFVCEDMGMMHKTDLFSLFFGGGVSLPAWKFNERVYLQCGHYMDGVPDEACMPLPGDSDVEKFDKENELTKPVQPETVT